MEVNNLANKLPNNMAKTGKVSQYGKVETDFSLNLQEQASNSLWVGTFWFLNDWFQTSSQNT